VLRPSVEQFRSLAARGNLIPVVREILADLDTPLSLFRRLDDGRTAFLLESVQGGENWARYSFLGTGARATFRARGREVENDRLSSSDRGYTLVEESGDGTPGSISGIDLQASQPIYGESLVLGSIVFSVNHENLAGDSIDIQAVLLDSVIGLEAGTGSFILDGAGNPVDLVGDGGSPIGLPMRATMGLLAASLCLFVFSGRRRDTDWHRL
jgi:hypothetical protein